jgi:hypothetical protein
LARSRRRPPGPSSRPAGESKPSRLDHGLRRRGGWGTTRPPFQRGDLSSRRKGGPECARPTHTTSGHPGRSFSLRGICGSAPDAPAISGAGSAWDAEKPAVVTLNTYADLQDFYRSDGTRPHALPHPGSDAGRAAGLEPATSGVTVLLRGCGLRKLDPGHPVRGFATEIEFVHPTGNRAAAPLAISSSRAATPRMSSSSSRRSSPMTSESAWSARLRASPSSRCAASSSSDR